MKFTAALALPALAAAIPAKKSGCISEGFTVQQVKNPHWHGKDFLCDYLAALNRWSPHGHYHQKAQSRFTQKMLGGKKKHSGKPTTGGKAQAGSVVANPQIHNSEYLSPVTVGSTQVTLNFDSGSSDLWVLGPETNAGASHHIYTPAGPKQPGETWAIQYGDGSYASGDVYTDTVTLAGVTVKSQGVEVATAVSNNFLGDAADGLVGLAFDSLNRAGPKKVPTFLTNAAKQGMRNVYCADLRYGTAGSYDFGKVDSSKYTGTIAYAPVDSSQGYWIVSPSKYSHGPTRQAAIDTGTTLILVQQSVVDAYYQSVPGAGYSDEDAGYTYDCSATLPNFSVTIGGYTAVVQGSHINYSPASESGKCLGGIQATSENFDVLGGVFIASQYVVFDQSSTTPRLGVAAKAGGVGL